MSSEPLTHYCIRCGRTFRAAGPDVVLCPQCGGPPEAIQLPAQEAESPPPAPSQPRSIPRTSAPIPSAPPFVPVRQYAGTEEIPVEWQPGDVILNLYEVRQEFEGGMGKVYRVHHRGWNIDLAVKSPRAEFFRSPTHRDAFVREAETWVKLGMHPHIVTCHYVRTLGGIPRLFADFVAGGTLEYWITRRRLASLDRMLDVAIQIAWGLDHAHRQGLIHRDVKPHNVMMTPDGTARVTDFGLARAVAAVGEADGGLSSEGVAWSSPVSMGGMTPVYCSPEQADQEPLTFKTDVWSWAVSVLEMFIGGATWMAGQAAGMVLENYLKEGPEDSTIPPMPAAVADLLRRCFQVDPQQRPAGMADIAGELQAIYEQEIGQPYPRRMPGAVQLRADSLNNRALSYLDLGMPDAALACWREAAGENPTHLETVFNLGYREWRAGEISDLQLVKRLDELEAANNWRPEYWRTLAAVQIERGDRDSAKRALQQAAIPDAESLLSSPGPDFRPFHTFEMPAGLYSVACSSDGRYLAASGMGKHVWLLDLVGRGQVQVIEVPVAHELHTVIFSPDDQYVLCGAAYEEVWVWEIASGRCVLKITEKSVSGSNADRLTSLVFTPDRSLLISTYSRMPIVEYTPTVALWEIPSGRYAGNLDTPSKTIYTAAVSPDNRYALIGGQRHQSGTAVLAAVTPGPQEQHEREREEADWLELWDLHSRRFIRAFAGHTDAVRSAVFSPDGRYALSGGDDGAVCLWEVSGEIPGGKLIRKLRGHTSAVYSVAFSPDGRYALSGGQDKTVRVWDLKSARCLRTLEGHTGTIHTVLFTPGGDQIISGSRDQTIRVWSARLEESPGCDFLISVPQAARALIERQQQIEGLLSESDDLMQQGNFRQAYMLLRDAQSVAGYEKSAPLLDRLNRCAAAARRVGFRSGWPARTFEGHPDGITCVGFSPDGRLAISASRDRSVRIWDVASAECVASLTGYNLTVSSAVFSPDGRYIVTASKAEQTLSEEKDYTLRLWEVDTLECISLFEGCQFSLSSALFTPDGQYVVSAGWHVESKEEHGVIRLWEVRSGHQIATFEGHSDVIQALALSRDGRLMVSAGRDRTLRLWEISSGRCLRTLEGHRAAVCAVAITPDGRYALSGSADDTLKLWDLSNAMCVLTFQGHSDTVHTVALTPDGQYALSAGEDQDLRLWEVQSGFCVKVFEGHNDAVTSVAFSPDGRYALSGGYDRRLILWEFDWEWEF